MMGRSMLQRLRQISISSSLRGAFLMGALLTLIVSSVSLYSWHEQSSQIRYSLDEYFPRIHSAFLIEGNLNLVVDQLNEFLLAPNTTVRLQLRNQIIQHLDKIERLSQGLSPAERQQLAVILQDSRALLAELDRVLYNMFLVREKVGELSARIDWLHDDFTTELNSLVQDFTWQQGTLLDQIEARQGDAAQYLKRSREVQNEQQQVYTLARIENQIVDDLRDRLNELKSGNDDGMLVETHIRYLENLKKTSDENIRALDDWPSTITLRQTIDELLEIGMVKNKMPDTMRDYVTAQKALVEASRAREATLGRFRTLLEAQLGSSHQQMQMFNQRMGQIVRVSGGLILVATLLALLLAWGLNHYFIRSRLKPQQGTLLIPDDTVWILGDEVRVHQVLVNVLSNALDACPHAAQITVSWQIQGERLCVLIADNGPGWPAALLPSLLKPFTTSKAVGLGIGLSICVSLMTQMEGALRLASTFTRSACVVLEFNLTDVKDVE